MTADLQWSEGGEATVLAASADAIRLRSTIPSPPGSRITGTLEGAAGAVVRVKIHGCKRQEDGSFLLEGRPLDLTRDVRALLEQLPRKEK
jgi:hypothetical protein